MSKGIYTYGPKALDMQMMEYFDPITGKTKKDVGKSGTRTFLSDLLDMTWMYDARKLAEVEAGLQLYWGMMYNKYVNQVDENGNVNKISYANAFELGDDKIIRLKPGIDPEYSMHKMYHTFTKGDTFESLAKKYNTTVEKLQENNDVDNISDITEGDEIIISNASEFNNFKLTIQGVGKKLNGLMDEMDSPRASQYLGWRLFSFYRAFSIPLFLNRFQFDTSKENFGGRVYDFNLGGLTKGYYIEAGQAAWKLLKTGFKYWPSMLAEEKAAFRKVIAEGAMLAALGLIAGFVFGYDDEDEERFEKMKKREEVYGPMGWLANHLLYQTLAVQSEAELFIPIVGTDELYSFIKPTSYAGGPLIGNSIKAVKDSFNAVTGDESAIYTQDVGPYSWQEEGDYKFWNDIGGMFGVKGRNRSAIQAIKNREISENLQ
jgi:LysM repeat protein